MVQEKSKEEVREYVKRVAERKGWILNTNEETLDDLVDGLQKYWNKVGYFNCPCRDTNEDRKLDRDIICPCKYAREYDVENQGYCYCALFFREDFDFDSQSIKMIPDRRPVEKYDVD